MNSHEFINSYIKEYYEYLIAKQKSKHGLNNFIMIWKDMKKFFLLLWSSLSRGQVFNESIIKNT